MKKYFILFIILINISGNLFSQGCVAIRSNGSVCTRQEAGDENNLGWQFNMSHRYFKSYKHFVGKVEEHERVDSGTDVRNWQHAINLTLIRNINHRWSLMLDLPLLFNRRSSMYEHYGNSSKNPMARRSTHSNGVGDIRIAASYWLLNPSKATKGNVQVGLGIKLATGNYRVEDYFWKTDSTYLIGPVDQSIQLGDGGTGITAELNGYYNFTSSIGVYGNLYYLINPMEQNGVSTSRGSTPSATAVKYYSNTMSIPDQYMIRAGANFSAGKLMAAAGIRMEGIPANDLVGGSRGFRRPGYVISIEPSVSYRLKNLTVFAAVPLAVERNRTQSNADKLRTMAEGRIVHGDAAFANYSLNAGLSFRLK